MKRQYFFFRYIVMILIVVFNFQNAAWAQNKGYNAFMKGQQYIATKQWHKAAQQLQKAIQEDGQQTDYYMTLARLYVQQNLYDDAIKVYQQANTRCPKCVPSITLPFAKTLIEAAKYAEAAQLLDNWQQPQNLPEAIKLEYTQLRSIAKYTQKAPPFTSTDTPLNLGFRINTPYDDYFPAMSIDDSTLIFTSKYNGADEDFYIAHRDSCGGWFQARNMGAPPNSTQQDGGLMVSADGHYLFFMRCGNRSENGWAGGGCDLYYSYIDHNGWSVAEPFGATLNTPAYEGMPSLSSDNTTLYFVSDREGGFGGKDIWVSRYENGLWQVPENLGPTINTPFDETAPHLAADNTTLFFTSNGHPGFGGNDIFFSRYNHQQWSRPENLGHPINSSLDDVSACVSPIGNKLYFASNRLGGIGHMDIYEIALPEFAKPKAHTYVYGVVYDSLAQHNKLAYAQIEWNDAATGEKLYHFKSNRGDGSYMAALPLNQKLAVNVYRFGYNDYQDTITFTESHILLPDTINFPLLGSDYSPPLHDTLVYMYHYEKNKITLADSVQQHIIHLLVPYLQQPLAEVYINSFTDDSGTPQINEQYSSLRANSVADVLILSGWPSMRIHAQGWADASPLVPNDTDENRYLNRRIEIILRKP
jgi:outer membrane protein OmpA-like peptidoglycan-associated protein